MHKNAKFEEYVFLDETMITLWDLPLYHWRLPGNYPEAIPCTVKDRKKVNVFGAISFKGPSKFVIINTWLVFFLDIRFFYVLT